MDTIGHILPVLLCGGAGTLLWPLLGERTLLQAAAERSSDIGAAAPLIVCSEGLRFMVESQLARIGLTPGALLVEPHGRGTAPALTAAAVHALAADDPVLLALPSDHLVTRPQAFLRALRRGAALARRGYIVAFGAPAVAPETAYGYLRAGLPILAPGEPGDPDAHFVEAFVEKPDAATARSYVESRQYRWNAGILAVRASVWIDAVGCYNRAMLAACERAYRNAEREPRTREQAAETLSSVRLRLHAPSFSQCPSDSIDCAILERIAQDASFPAAVVSLDAGWADAATRHRYAGEHPHAAAGASTAAGGAPGRGEAARRSAAGSP